MNDADIHIRGVRVADIAAMHELCADLGYDTEPSLVPERLNRIVSDPSQAVYVAERDGGVVGFVHLFTRHALEIDACAQIQALVVGPDARRNGAAALLITAAEVWARGRGLAWLSLYCTTNRDAAHDFYPALGFEAASTATRFNKRLDG